MSEGPDAPAGFVATPAGPGWLVALEARLPELERQRLDREEGWRERLDTAAAGPSRGKTAILRLAPDLRLRLKQLRRGGLTRSLWRDRFPGTRRLLDNLRIPAEARRRGIPTPAPVALLLRPGPPGLYRAWLAVEELDDAVDLAARFASSHPPAREELGTVMTMVRNMHDRGLEHRDLNLGNLLVRPAAGAARPGAFVIDLDRARLHEEPLGFAARQRALRRLERSYVKWVPAVRQRGEERQAIYGLYAKGDDRMSARLARGRLTGRLGILVHRPGWWG